MENYIQKLIEEFDAKNPPEVLLQKKELENKIREVLEKLNADADPVFKEFAENPLAMKTKVELKEEINNFANMANENEKICKPAKMMIINICDMFVYRSFCIIENFLKNNDVDFYSTYTYEFIINDLVNHSYDVKKNLDISMEDLLSYTYYLGFKDYIVTFVKPLLKYITTHKDKMHLNLMPYKRSPFYKFFLKQRDFILQDKTLSNMYNYFIMVYKEASLNFKI